MARTGKGKGSHPNTRAALRRYQFKPGQSGNPGGLPKGSTKPSIALMKLLGMAEEDVANLRPGTCAERIALTIYQKAVAGDVQALRELFDRSEGRAKQSVNLTVDTNEAQKYEHKIERLMDVAQSKGRNMSRGEVITFIAKTDPHILDVMKPANDVASY